MSGLGELFNTCLGVAFPIGLILIATCCTAPIAQVLGATGRRKTRRRKSQKLGIREVVSLILVIILLAISFANGTVPAMLTSLLSK